MEHLENENKKLEDLHQEERFNIEIERAKLKNNIEAEYKENLEKFKI